MRFLSIFDLPSAATAEGATTPVPPDGSGSLIYSTVANKPLFFNGSAWINCSGLIAPVVAVADQTASGVATDVSMSGVVTLAANSLAAGATFKFEAAGLHSNSITAGTVNFWIKVNGTKQAAIAVASTTTSKSNIPWWVHAMLTFRVIGASGTLEISNRLEHAITAAAAINYNVLGAPLAVATSSAVTLEFGFNWTAGVAGNILTAKNAQLTQVK